MGLFGKSKKEREKEYMNRLDVPSCLKEDFELIIDDIFTIMGSWNSCHRKHINRNVCREGENACVYNKWRYLRNQNYYCRCTYKRTKSKWLWI